jgi:hypothetical protein
VDHEQNGGELAEMTQALEEASANLYLADVTDPGLTRLTELADGLGLSVYLGHVAFAGQSSTGSTQVQFNVDGGAGYASFWPGWAYELAKAAVLNGRRLFIIANGDPIGSNLSYVYIFGT